MAASSRGRPASGRRPRRASPGLSTSELLFLAQVRRLLGELYDNGLSHASAIAAGQLRALTMSARGENLPRLAAMLRGLGGTLDLLVRRDYHASERLAFDEMAAIYALCAALEQASDQPLQRLRGQARRSFDAAGEAPLELLPLGAYWWETRGGAHGLTLSFWDHAAARIVQAVLARPRRCRPLVYARVELACDQLVAGRRQRTAPVRAGPGALGRLAGRRWPPCHGQPGTRQRGALVGARRRTLAGDWGLPTGRRWPPFQGQRRPDGAEQSTACCCGPVPWRAPQLDEVRQQLDWQVFDANGAVLNLMIPAQEALRARITRLQAAVTDGADIRAVLASRARGEADGWQPVSLLIARNGKLRVVSLDFAVDAGKLPSALSRFFRSLAGTRHAPPVPAAIPATSRVLAQLLELLAMQARSGRPRLEAELAHELARHGATLHALGLDLPARLLAAYLQAPTAGHALKLAHVCTTCMALGAAR